MMPANSASFALDDATRVRAAPAASWGAILAGAAVAVSLSLILLTLGAGLEFASISPWPDRGASATGFTVAGAIWLIVTQWLSAAAGGYVAGRLRHRWLATHSHEVFFRDTAHGLVTWCVATLVFVAFLTGSFASLAGGGVQAAGALAAAGAPAAMRPGGVGQTLSPRGPSGQDSAGGPNGAYDIDKLFRNSSPGGSPGPEQGGRGNDARMEVMHITSSAVPGEAVSEDDRTYLTQLVAAKTGVSTEDAQKRVDNYLQGVKEVTLKAKGAADQARKAAASAAIYSALSMLMGAFIASVAAALGGRLRDEHL
jgi:hypothetical protein